MLYIINAGHVFAIRNIFKYLITAIQCVKFNSVPIDPTTGNNFKNQAALTKNKENQKNNNSFENRNFSDHTDKQNGR